MEQSLNIQLRAGIYVESAIRGVILSCFLIQILLRDIANSASGLVHFTEKILLLNKGDTGA